MAMREVSTADPTDSATIVRDNVESNLQFLGFINFKNSLREETKDVIHELEEGDVRPIMVTGDSIFTGVCIAKESGIISPKSQGALLNIACLLLILRSYLPLASLAT